MSRHVLKLQFSCKASHYRTICSAIIQKQKPWKSNKVAVPLTFFPDCWQIFEVLDLNKDLELSWEEVFTADVLELLRKFRFLIPEMEDDDAEQLRALMGEDEDVNEHDEL